MTARCPFAAADGARRAAVTVAVGALLALGVLAPAGCDSPAQVVPGSGGRGGGGGAGGASGDLCAPSADPLAAALGIASHPDEGASHTVLCDAVTYTTRPPSSGPHYPVWPAYQTYQTPIPWGFLVHGLEHGAMVVVYNCPAGCASEVAAAEAWIDALPVESTVEACAGDAPRVILAPDPSLDVRWAASAWTWTLRACAFDPTMFQTFFDVHYGHGLEAVCRSAFDADQSATGWCP